MNMMIYIEVNLLCMALLGIMGFSFRRKRPLSGEGLLFIRMLKATCLMCASDMAAGVLRGAMFPGARLLLWISNMLYQMTPGMIGSLWVLYALRVLYGKVQKHVPIILALLFGLFCIPVLTTPWTGALFTLDEMNLYHRGPLLIVMWVYGYGTVLIPSILALMRQKQCRDWVAIACFIVAPVLCCILQNLFYGLTTAQAGITASLFMLYVMLQSNELHQLRMREEMFDELSRTDSLTGLPNRRAYEQAISDIPESGQTGVIFCDLNGLKTVNDTMGHQAGDELIISLCRLLKNHIPVKSLYRISGDEFVALLPDMDADGFQTLCGLIDKQLGTGVDRVAAMGYACGPASSGILSLISAAEKKMYADKQAYYLVSGKDRRHYAP